MTTDERLEALEKELARAKRRNRRMLAVVGLAAGGVALVWIVAGTANRAQAQAGGVPAVIRARQFILEDAAGETRAVLLVAKDGPSLALYDENGQGRAALSVLKGEPGLLLFDANGKGRVALAVTKYGPGLYLRDAAGKTVWSAP